MVRSTRRLAIRTSKSLVNALEFWTFSDLGSAVGATGNSVAASPTRPVSNLHIVLS